jgi:protein HOOK3
LTQICKFCLCISVWASGNEKVVHKIQTLDAKVQEELMRCINEVSATLPLAEGEAEEMASQMQARGSKRTSPEKRSIAQAE